MDRRRFLTVLGLGAAGGAGSGLGWRARNAGADRAAPEAQKLAGTSSGQQRIVWSVDTASPVAALTFDDGPDPDFTPRILEVLDAYSVTATFFSLGHNAAQHPRLLREVVAAGHEIGSHGWKHLNLSQTTAEETRREIVQGTELVEDHAEARVRAFRPPYGRFNEIAVRLLAERQQDMYVWSVTRGELAWQEPWRVARHVIESTRPGDIVDLHDGIGRGTFQREEEFAQKLIRRRKVEVDALPRILEDAGDAGIRFATVSDLMTKVRPADPRA